MRAAFIIISRLKTLELNQMINTSAQILRDSNSATSRTQQSSTLSLSSAILQLSTPSEFRSMKDLMNISRRITAHGSPMLRTSARENQK
jgi:hypothetical protein